MHGASLELVALKAAIEQMQQDHAFSERRACRLMTLAVSSYRYETRRSDEPLRTKRVELAREKPRFGHGDCMCCCAGAENE